ncbi:MAG TPA: hypothetical protein VFC05_11780 [Nitrososphaeraceae archaeon]|nr:hypothetical protein [Nitrososphaeraceae archaeon]
MRGICTAITWCPASFRIGITLLHEEPSAHAPWTRTILVVFFVKLCIPWDCVKVLFSGLAKPENVGDVKITIKVIVRHNKGKNLTF